MRIISGKYRSRRLKTLPGRDTRPTADRLRETLFNVITAGQADALEGSVWLDLYAGGGAIGLEALSRGARMVYAVESSGRAATVIRENVRGLGIEQGFQLCEREVMRALRLLDAEAVACDYCFLDPPYDDEDAYRQTLDFLSRAQLVREGTVIAEHQRRFDPGEQYGALRRVRLLEQGDAALSFYGWE